MMKSKLTLFVAACMVCNVAFAQTKKTTTSAKPKTTSTTTTKPKTTPAPAAKPAPAPVQETREESRPSAAPASSYRTAAGLRIDFGTGGTGVGLNAKHFIKDQHAIDAHLLFFSGDVIALGAEYNYHLPIQNADGLQFYFGGGPGVAFGSGYTEFMVRPVGGLDYKINEVPINMSFDWRPMISFGEGDNFTAARFGLSFRYAF